jgi:hypothetical protein
VCLDIDPSTRAPRGSRPGTKSGPKCPYTALLWMRAREDVLQDAIKCAIEYGMALQRDITASREAAAKERT